jgi:hypothetical protein
MASQPGLFNFQALTNFGDLAAGHRLYTYAPSTTTQKNAFTDQAGTIPHTYTADGLGGQYIALNARGELPAPLWLAAGGYDIALKTPQNVTVWTRRAVGSDDAANTVIADLASTATATQGAGQIGFLHSLAYGAGTVGEALKRGVFADAGRLYRMVAFVLRNDGSGWGYINDIDHAPVGMEPGAGGVEVVNLGGGVKVLRTHYSFTASRVLSLFGGNDETMAARGLEFGPSVGLDYSDWRLYMPMTCWVDKNAGAYSFGNIDPWLGPGTDTTVALTPSITDGSSFTITHLTGSADDVPVVAPIRGNATASLDVAVTYGGTSVRVDFMEDLHGYVFFDGSNWQVQTPNSSKPTFSFSSGVLTVTHENIGDVYDTNITGVGGVLVITAGTPSGVAITRATSFLVTFQDYAGAAVNTANANMKFFYSRPRKVRTVPPDGARVAVRRGPVLVDPAKVTSSTGNIWALGLMEV